MKARLFGRAAFALVRLAGLFLAPVVRATADDVATTIRALDDRFWQAYNSCDTAAFRQFFTDDVEFYHDKGGATLGAEALVASMKKGLCGDGSRLRREAVEGTVQLFPLHDRQVTYGAVLSGEHVFYVLEPGKAERLDGRARFMDLWLQRDGAWRMARILSYDHGPAPYVSKRSAIALRESALDAVVGPYRAPKSGPFEVRRAQGTLVLTFGGQSDGALTLYPEREGLFFVKERDLTFEFVKSSADAWTIRVREGGALVEEAVSGP